MSEQELLADCVRRLNRLGIDYLVTGSMASNYWGMPRTTNDLDFVIQLRPSAIAQLVEDFSADFHADADAIRTAYQPPFQFNFIDLRSSLKVDFWMLQPAPFDRAAFSRRVQVPILGEKAWMASAEDINHRRLVIG